MQVLNSLYYTRRCNSDKNSCDIILFPVSGKSYEIINQKL